MSAEVFIPLTKGRVTVIDLDDFEKVRDFKWRTQRSGNGEVYAGRTQYRPEKHIPGKQGDGGVTVLLHSFLLGPKLGLEIDHINGDTLDNRRSNLRFVTRSQNCANQKIRSTNKSGFKGVNWKKPGKRQPTGRWVSRISVGMKRIQLGYFSTAEEAARAYDAAAQHYFGEFAKLNFPTL